MDALTNQGAKERCETEGTVMMGAENRTLIESLMNLLDFSKLVYTNILFCLPTF
jgi:hypothetical protein